MSELYRELQEDLQRMKLENVWKKYGPWVIRLSVAIVVATVIGVSWNYLQRSRAAEHTAQMIKGLNLLNEQQYGEAIAAFDKIGDDGVYGHIAQLRKAEAQRLSGDSDGAKKTLEKLAAQNEGDKGGEFVALAKLAVALEAKKDSPFYYSQTENRAWALMQEGKTDEAAGLFAQLQADEKAPGSLRARARQMTERLAPDKLETSVPMSRVRE